MVNEIQFLPSLSLPPTPGGQYVMRMNQNKIVLGTILAAIAIAAIAISVRSGKSHRAVMRSSVNVGLEQVFDTLAARKRHDSFHPDDIKSVIADESRALLPSFVNSKDVLITASPVNISSNELL